MYKPGLIVVALVLSACASSPDIDRAVENYRQGYLAEAKRELEPLAAFGLPEAKLRLADVLTVEGGISQWQRAEVLYSELIDTHPRAYERLGKLYRKRWYAGEADYFDKAVSTFQTALRAQNTSVLDELIGLYLNNPETIEHNLPISQWITELSETNPYKADYFRARLLWISNPVPDSAQSVAEICQPIQDAIFQCVELLAEVYGQVGDEASLKALTERSESGFKQGQIQAEQIYSLAKQLSVLQTPMADAFSQHLYRLISDDYPRALTDFVSQAIRQGFNGDKAVWVTKLKHAAKHGDIDANYLLGRMYYKGDWVPKKPELAQAYFSQVEENISGAAVALGVMHRDGWLGKPDFDAALRYLLDGARRGSEVSDRLLAEMFWLQRGVKRNPVYAYSFSKLATGSNDEKSLKLFSEIAAEVSAMQKAQGERLYEEEQRFRTGSDAVSIQTPEVAESDGSNI